ncbi:carotenoid 1,2-hydratase [Ramlibacter sp. G-1-2-2]|uniref:Carotenoid 1,2-hydratase n=1 Tax=Ramlibacter agri TaxID=2728837 RepID=A0A848H8V3_9BURK|nr:carotenoid 1,2-hydratase [Ramlibacter agri]NML46392.1 carotenoid 1,2-hydratase [Ramlibacter agri]
MRRRPLLFALPAFAFAGPAVLTERKLAFPRDHGAHPDLRTEWWYITGELRAGERRFGFQVTFFRSRVDETQQMQSRFAARQLVFAHAAVTDVQGRKLWHDGRIARAGFGIAGADEADAHLVLQDWSLARAGETWQARVPARDFALDLRCTPTQPVLLQGRGGLSRKGPDPEQASYYYSLPQLAVAGRLSLQGKAFEVAGKAWLDHEWSEALMHPDAVGWDWIGMNLDDGSALTAFRLRRKDGSTLWDGGSFRSADGRLFIAKPGETEFKPGRRWASPSSRASYPVEWTVRTPADFYAVRAVIDNQELDSRGSTGAIYWEGLSELFDSNGRKVGAGYLEMTGYASPLRL